jgi:hypothetical protein
LVGRATFVEESKGLSILTGYKLPREWNEPFAWHEINLAHKFPVKTNVPARAT